MNGSFFRQWRRPRHCRDLLPAASLRHGTGGFNSLPKEGTVRIYFALKNPTGSPGFEPANLGARRQRANPQTTEAAILPLYYHLVFRILQQCVC
jgi:hypothetical protein